MKKIALLLIVALVLGVSAAAYAGAVKCTFMQGADPITGEESGFVVINWITEDKVIAQFQVRGLDPNEDYWAYVRDDGDTTILGPLKVNKHGSGHLHMVVDPGEPSTPGVEIGITTDGVGAITQILYADTPALP